MSPLLSLRLAGLALLGGLAWTACEASDPAADPEPLDPLALPDRATPDDAGSAGDKDDSKAGRAAPPPAVSTERRPLSCCQDAATAAFLEALLQLVAAFQDGTFAQYEDRAQAVARAADGLDGESAVSPQTADRVAEVAQRIRGDDPDRAVELLAEICARVASDLASQEAPSDPSAPGPPHRVEAAPACATERGWLWLQGGETLQDPFASGSDSPSGSLRWGPCVPLDSPTQGLRTHD